MCTFLNFLRTFIGVDSLPEGIEADVIEDSVTGIEQYTSTISV